ncbi:MAG: hypothetical protein ACLQGP_02410 [Isosphaeraceae bacterium]
MLYAVTIEPFNAIFFVSESPGADEWEVQEGAELDLPFNYDSWPEGAEPPEQILCTSVSDPKRYKIFKYARDIDPGEFQPTGKHFGGIYSRSTWSRFMENLPGALTVQNVLDTEPPGATDRAVAAIKRRD